MYACMCVYVWGERKITVCTCGCRSNMLCNSLNSFNLKRVWSLLPKSDIEEPKKNYVVLISLHSFQK